MKFSFFLTTIFAPFCWFMCAYGFAVVWLLSVDAVQTRWKEKTLRFTKNKLSYRLHRF